MKDVKSIVLDLVKKYETNNPYKILKEMGIYLQCGSLGDIQGCYMPLLNRKVIFVNSDLPEMEQYEICAHELGHAIMHCEDYYFYTMENVTYRQKAEIEADMFAAELLIPDDVIIEHPEYTKGQIASCVGCSEKLVEFKKFRQNEKR